MEKENSASSGGGGGENTATVTGGGATSASEKLQADQANPLLDPSALFGGKHIFSNLKKYWKTNYFYSLTIFISLPSNSLPL